MLDNLDTLSDEELMKLANQSDDGLDNLSDEDLLSLSDESSLEQPKKKSIWSTVGAEITDQMKQEHPVLSKIAQTGQDALSVPADFVNQFGLNYPRAALNKVGIEYPEAQDPTLRTAQKVGGVAGALVGGGKFAKAIGLMKPGMKAGEVALKSGVAGAAYADTEKPLDLQQKALQAGAGALTGGLLKAAQGAKASIDTATKGAPSFLRKVRGAVTARKAQAVEEFGAQLDDLATKNPETRVSIANSLDKLRMEITGGQMGDVVIPPNPKIASIVNRSPTLKAYFNNPEAANNVSLRESQAIINELRNKLPAMKKAGLNVTSDDIPLFDLIDDIRGNQLDAFPEMEGVKQAYGQVLSKYNLIKNRIREGSFKRNLMNNFGDSPESKQAFEGLLTSDILKEVKNFKNTNKLLKAAGLGIGSATVGAAWNYGSSLIPRLDKN